MCSKGEIMSMPTKYGLASINQDGYYEISSVKEGNFHKLLHRLVWEEHFCKIPDGYVVHHKDGNKLNNDINNLESMSFSEHTTHLLIIIII